MCAINVIDFTGIETWCTHGTKQSATAKTEEFRQTAAEAEKEREEEEGEEPTTDEAAVATTKMSAAENIAR